MLSISGSPASTPNFTDAMQLEMMETPGFTAGKVGIDAGGNDAVVKVRVDKSVKRPDDVVLRFRATGKLASGATVEAPLAEVKRRVLEAVAAALG